MATKRSYGWIPDTPDQRDYLYAAQPELLAKLPPAVDLRPQCPSEIYDQGDLNSCTANAIAAAIEFDQMAEKLPKVFTPSRLFIWYNERAMEGTVASNVGASIRDGIKSVAHQGVCPESEWPYNPANFTVKPSDQSYQDALQNKAVSYQRVVQTLNQMKGCLASGYPFVFGFGVYQSFEDDSDKGVGKTGHAVLPGPTEVRVGGHAVLAVGYDDANQWFIVRNSWGPNWGLNGYFTMPYAYPSQPTLANDFWTIRVVTEGVKDVTAPALAGAVAR